MLGSWKTRGVHAIAGAAFAVVFGSAMTPATRAQENDVPIYSGVFSPEQATIWLSRTISQLIDLV